MTQTKSDLLAHWQANVYARLRPSKLAGVGVFAIRDMPKGACPFVMLNEEAQVFKLTAKDLKALHPERAAMIRDYYAYDKKRACWLVYSDPNQPPLQYFVNNGGKAANLTWDADLNHYVAARAVKKDEELTSDYATVSDEPAS